MYYLYLLRCSDNSLYCGQTNDLKRRIKEHNSPNSKSKYTRSKKPVELVYFEKYQTINEALKRESEIKKMTKEKKENLIKQTSFGLNKILQNNLNKKILFLLSGGSAFNLLKKIDKQFLNPNFTISVLDERFSSDPDINNFLQLSKTNFYKNAKEKACQFIKTVPKTGESLETMTLRLENNIRQWRLHNKKGIIIITQGIGIDGHTAGIMPYPEDEFTFKKLFQSNRWIVGYDASNKNQFSKRITVTITFLIKQVDYSFVYAVGKDKQVIINDVIHNDVNLSRLPASVIQQMKNVQMHQEL
jgi:putative endonuclease